MSTARDRRYYTRQPVCDLLVGIVETESIRPSVVDLGSGGGALSLAAAARWSEGRFVTVDREAGPVRAEGSDPRWRHLRADVLDGGLALLTGGGFDVALSNPPYAAVPWQADFAQTLVRGGLGELVQDGGQIGAEALFAAQALSLLRDGGHAALVVSDGMVTGRRDAALRKALCANHRVVSVGQLPEGAFFNTEARAFLMLVVKGGTTSDIELYGVDRSCTPRGRLSVPACDAEERLDHGWHAGRSGPHAERPTLAALGASIVRGSLTSAASRDAAYPVFHTSDFPRGDALRHGLRSEGQAIPDRLVVAEPGDILVARVDRQLHRKVCLVASGRAALTDCVWRVRMPEGCARSAAEALASEGGEAYLRVASRGVAARMLSKAGLSGFRAP